MSERRGGPRKKPDARKGEGRKPDARKSDGRKPGPRKAEVRDVRRPPKPARTLGDQRPATVPVADSGLAVRVSRVLNVPASAIFRAVTDTERRGWAPQQLYRVVSILAPRFIRLAFPDGSLVAIGVTRQGNARCTVTVEHTRLPEGTSENQMRDQWGMALAALAEQLDLEWD
jgi:hypothetical protein